MIDFRQIAGVVMDMDGVLWRGNEALPGLTAFFDFLRGHALPFALATNNSRMSQRDYVEKLARMGVHDIRLEQIVTSGTATAAYVQRHYPAGSTIHVLGGDGLREVLTNAGYKVTGALDLTAVAVTVGLDFELTYEKLKNATLTLHAGADFIATNGDLTFPSPEGLIPGAGSIAAALSAASGRQPISMGKPAAPMFEAAIAVMGTSAQYTLMIGDRLDTDIAGAAALGLPTALVLTGVTTREDAAAAPVPPNAVFEGLIDLMTMWKNVMS